MIIYEINISIPKDLNNDYMIWLKNHIQTMHTFKGFLKYKLFSVKSDDSNIINVCVHYYIKSIVFYDLYIQNYSNNMRLNTPKIFNKVKINRRVLNEVNI